MQKSVVLLSGGLDSTVNFFEAAKHTEVLQVITFDYGQRAARAEIRCSQALCRQIEKPHEIITLPFFKIWGGSALTSPERAVPTGADVNIEDHQSSEETAKAVWVPNRNGIFLNIAAGCAEALGAELVIPGFNLEEASTFADNSEDFLRSLNVSLGYSTRSGVKVHCYTTQMNKLAIVQRGLALGVDFSMTWPCYFDGEGWCGECESCLRAKRAFQGARVAPGGFR